MFDWTLCRCGERVVNSPIISEYALLDQNASCTRLSTWFDMYSEMSTLFCQVMSPRAQTEHCSRASNACTGELDSLER